MPLSDQERDTLLTDTHDTVVTMKADTERRLQGIERRVGCLEVEINGDTRGGGIKPRLETLEVSEQNLKTTKRGRTTAIISAIISAIFAAIGGLCGFAGCTQSDEMLADPPVIEQPQSETEH